MCESVCFAVLFSRIVGFSLLGLYDYCNVLHQVLWLKDGTPLELTERHFFTANDQLLIIVQTRSEDAGLYTCEMSNTLGTERGSSVLQVISGISMAMYTKDDIRHVR